MRPRVVVRAALLLALSGCGLTLSLDPDAQDSGAVRDTAVGDARFDIGPDTRADTGADTGPGLSCVDVIDCPDDGDACNGTPTCIDGVCDPGDPITCDDGDPCNGLETCSDGACANSSPETCDDDGDVCNGTEACVPFVGCTSVEPLDCNDDVPCTDDECDNAAGGCIHLPNDAVCNRAAGGWCDPSSGCQYPECVEGDTCVSGPCYDASCEDDMCVREFRCATTESCCGGTCVPRNCDDGNPCTADSCSEPFCVNAPLDGTVCSDGDACTVGDACMGGSCRGFSARVCNDSNPCTQDFCDPDTGCSHPPRIGNSVVCNTNAVCSGTACTCVSGFEDCDMNESCECAAGGCLGSSCGILPTDCPGTCLTGEVCCSDRGSLQVGNCVPRSCPGEPAFDGCCPAVR